MGDVERELLGHFLGALAYRTQKALRDAPDGFADFSPGHRARTPAELLGHMTSLMGYVATMFTGGSYPRRPDPLGSLEAEAARFHAMLETVAQLLASGTPMTITDRQLLQGPLADAMTHVGQLAMLRRLADAPVPPENFIHADVRGDRLGPDQPGPARAGKPRSGVARGARPVRAGVPGGAAACRRELEPTPAGLRRRTTKEIHQ